MAAADGDADRARAAYEFLTLEDPEESPDAAGEAHRTVADVERMLGDADAERQHLEQATHAFKRKGNVVRAQQVADRLAGLGQR